MGWGDQFEEQQRGSTPSVDTEQRRKTKDDPFVGGFAVAPVRYPSTIHGGVGTYGPGTAPSAPLWEPYTVNAQRHILSSVVTQGGIYDLQLALVQAGFLDDDDVGFGIVDDATDSAFASVLAVANQHGLPWQDVLSQAAAAGGTFGGGFSSDGKLKPDIYTLPNRDDLRASLESMAIGDPRSSNGLTGVALDDDLLDAATESVLDTLRTQQERKVQQELAVGEGETAYIEDTPGRTEGSMARLLEEEIEERAPGLVMGKGVREAMDGWFEAIRGPV